MPLSIETVRDRTAELLGILPLGQSLESQDDERITQGYTEVFNYLKTKGIATWSSTADVPDDVGPWVVVLVAHNCLNGYGVSNDRYTRIMADYAVAEQKIRELTNIDNPSQEEPTDY